MTFNLSKVTDSMSRRYLYFFDKLVCSMSLGNNNTISFSEAFKVTDHCFLSLWMCFKRAIL